MSGMLLSELATLSIESKGWCLIKECLFLIRFSNTITAGRHFFCSNGKKCNCLDHMQSMGILGHCENFATNYTMNEN